MQDISASLTRLIVEVAAWRPMIEISLRYMHFTSFAKFCLFLFRLVFFLVFFFVVISELNDGSRNVRLRLTESLGNQGGGIKTKSGKFSNCSDEKKKETVIFQEKEKKNRLFCSKISFFRGNAVLD